MPSSIASLSTTAAGPKKWQPLSIEIEMRKKKRKRLNRTVSNMSYIKKLALPRVQVNNSTQSFNGLLNEIEYKCKRLTMSNKVLKGRIDHGKGNMKAIFNKFRSYIRN